MAFKDGFKPFPELTTRRLLLRQLVPEDAEPYFNGLSTVSPEIWGLRRHSVESTGRFLATRLRDFGSKSAIMWAIAERNGGSFIGEVKMFAFVYQSKAEIAYWLTDRYRRKGYGSEAVEAVVRFGFDVLGLHRVEAYAQPSNTGSCALLSKIGFTQEGVLRKFRNEGGRAGIWTDSAVFGLLREDYRRPEQ
jgi:ribosomal-protein-alanine N-acetyltransferase